MPVIVKSASTVAFNNSKRRMQHRQDQRKLYQLKDSEKANYKEASEGLLKDIRKRIQHEEKRRRIRNIKEELFLVLLSQLLLLIFCFSSHLIPT